MTHTLLVLAVVLLAASVVAAQAEVANASAK